MSDLVTVQTPLLERVLDFLEQHEAFRAPYLHFPHSDLDQRREALVTTLGIA